MREQAFLNAGLHISIADARAEDGKSDAMCYEGGIREFVQWHNRHKTPLHEQVIYMSGAKDGAEDSTDTASSASTAMIKAGKIRLFSLDRRQILAVLLSCLGTALSLRIPLLLKQVIDHGKMLSRTSSLGQIGCCLLISSLLEAGSQYLLSLASASVPSETDTKLQHFLALRK